MALNFFLRPGRPGDQPVGDLHAAQSAILVGVVNGLVSPPYLHRCLCDAGGRRCAAAAVEPEQVLCQLAGFLAAVLGVALLVVHMAFSAAAAVARSPPWTTPVVKWMVWLAKVLTGGGIQLAVNDLYFCLKILCARFIIAFA
ncbi:hypothetical protein ACP4OV_017773 [Aristida adscensionis]